LRINVHAGAKRHISGGFSNEHAQFGGRLLRIQVKATRHYSFSLAAEDLEGIRPRFPQDDGYLESSISLSR